MGIFDFFRKLSFFKNRSIDGLVEEDLDFAKWIGAHREWRRRLVRFIDGTSQEQFDETIVCRDDRCELGKWIYGHGNKFYGDLPVFTEMQIDHTAFHRAAGDVVGVFKAEGVKAAKKVLHADFDLYSMRVVSGLERLETRVKG